MLPIKIFNYYFPNAQKLSKNIDNAWTFLLFYFNFAGPLIDVITEFPVR